MTGFDQNPEGSNSAKSRRSDIVGNNDLDIHRKSSQFHEAGSDTLKSPDFHTDDGADARSVSDTSTDHTDKIHNETAASPMMPFNTPSVVMPI